MSTLDISGKVVDLAAYRAWRAATRRGARRSRYVLWYPGIGYMQPQRLSFLEAGTATKPR